MRFVWRQQCTWLYNKNFSVAVQFYLHFDIEWIIFSQIEARKLYLSIDLASLLEMSIDGSLIKTARIFYALFQCMYILRA